MNAREHMRSNGQATNKRFSARHPYVAIMKRVVRTTVGVILVLLGVVSVLTPFTPFGLLLPIGLEVLGLRILLENRVRAWADVHPNSRTAHIALRFVSWRPRGWVARWRHRLGRFRTPDGEVHGVISPDDGSSAEHEARETVAVSGSEDKTARPKDENG